MKFSKVEEDKVGAIPSFRTTSFSFEAEVFESHATATRRAAILSILHSA